MRTVGKRLTYANVVASLALFLALSGGVVWAASGKIGANKLKANSVTTGKIKRNAVTVGKIKDSAVTTAKIKNGAVDFAKLAAGTNLVATAKGGPVQANSTTPLTVALAGPTNFATQAGVVNFLSVEATSNLSRSGEEPCDVTVQPFVNGSEWTTAKGALTLSAFKPTADRPTGLIPLASVTGPIGLASPGVSQTVSVKVVGDTDCAPAATVSVAIAVTQAK